MDKHQLKLTNSQFATEHMLHDRLLNSYLRTDNPQEADFFFVPLFPMGVVYKYKKASDSEKQRLLDSISHFIPSKLRSTACTEDCACRPCLILLLLESGTETPRALVPARADEC